MHVSRPVANAPVSILIRAHDGTRPEDREDALTACRSGDARLKQAFLNAIASVALISRYKQSLIGCRPTSSPKDHQS
jgi:hypothetical protein